MELYAAVRRAVYVEGMSQRDASKRFGLARKTVHKMLGYSAPPGYQRKQVVKRPNLEAFLGVIDQILEEDKQQIRKQRHTAKRIFESGYLRNHRYVLHDRDTKFCASFRSILESERVKCLALPAHSPNLNAFAERWVRSVKQECLRKLVLFGEGSLRRALNEYLAHFHGERNHKGKGNVLLFPETASINFDSPAITRTPRLGGLLNFYGRAA